MFEVLSPFDRWSDVLEKIAEYLQASVEAVCVANPENRTVQVLKVASGARQLTATMSSASLRFFRNSVAVSINFFPPASNKTGIASVHRSHQDRSRQLFHLQLSAVLAMDGGRIAGDASRRLASPPAEAPLGLYLHIPFCRKRCKFCYFRVYTDKNARRRRNLRARPCRTRSNWSASMPVMGGRPFRFVYFGGGTPSFLRRKQLTSLVDRLRST